MARTYNGRFYLPEEPRVHSSLLVVGLALIPTWPSFFTMIASIVCFTKFGRQIKERKLFRCFHEYCAIIAWRGRVSLKELKQASPSGTGIGDVRRDVQQMIARGYFGSEAYIDLNRNELVLPDQPEAPNSGQARTWKDLIADTLDLLRGERLYQESAQEGDFDYREVSHSENVNAQAQPRPAPQPAPESKSESVPKSAPSHQRPRGSTRRTYAEELERTLNELYQLNERIEDVAVSERIDRIGTLTAGIFRALIEKPEREQDVRKFMNYYLPTTLKLLRSYDMLEDQKVQSQNIADSRKKIENVLDMLIQAFERQLDRLYRDDALDIATEIDVLESMMAGDGLSSGMEFPKH